MAGSSPGAITNASKSSTCLCSMYDNAIHDGSQRCRACSATYLHFGDDLSTRESGCKPPSPWNRRRTKCSTSAGSARRLTTTSSRS